MNREALVILLFLGLWIVLNKWLLPWLGIPTCMSGGCCGPSSCTIEPATTDKPPQTAEASEKVGAQSAEENSGKPSR